MDDLLNPGSPTADESKTVPSAGSEKTEPARNGV